MIKYRNLRLMTSAWSPKRLPATLLHYLRTRGTGRSLGNKLHDPVWARFAEASIPAAFHLGDSGYNSFAAAWGASATFEGFGDMDILSRVLVSDRSSKYPFGKFGKHLEKLPDGYRRQFFIENNELLLPNV